MSVDLSAIVENSDDWRERMRFIVQLMREVSLYEDPQAMVRSYGARMRQVMPADRWFSLSRRGLPAPSYRITRASTWTREVNPWTDRDQLPVLSGGLFGDLIYGDEPRLIERLEFDPSDPAAEYLAGQGSLIAVPLYDQGVALNMVVLLRKEPDAFDPDGFPEWVWLSNLFGRATHNLRLAEEVREAYRIVERK